MSLSQKIFLSLSLCLSAYQTTEAVISKVPQSNHAQHQKFSLQPKIWEKIKNLLKTENDFIDLKEHLEKLPKKDPTTQKNFVRVIKTLSHFKKSFSGPDLNGKDQKEFIVFLAKSNNDFLLWTLNFLDSLYEDERSKKYLPYLVSNIIKNIYYPLQEKTLSLFLEKYNDVAKDITEFSQFTIYFSSESFFFGFKNIEEYLTLHYKDIDNPESHDVKLNFLKSLTYDQDLEIDPQLLHPFFEFISKIAQTFEDHLPANKKHYKELIRVAIFSFFDACHQNNAEAIHELEKYEFKKDNPLETLHSFLGSILNPFEHSQTILSTYDNNLRQIIPQQEMDIILDLTRIHLLPNPIAPGMFNPFRSKNLDETEEDYRQFNKECFQTIFLQFLKDRSAHGHHGPLKVLTFNCISRTLKQIQQNCPEQLTPQFVKNLCRVFGIQTNEDYDFDIHAAQARHQEMHQHGHGHAHHHQPAMGGIPPFPHFGAHPQQIEVHVGGNFNAALLPFLLPAILGQEIALMNGIPQMNMPQQFGMGNPFQMGMPPQFNAPGAEILTEEQYKEAIRNLLEEYDHLQTNEDKRTFLNDKKDHPLFKAPHIFDIQDTQNWLYHPEQAQDGTLEDIEYLEEIMEAIQNVDVDQTEKEKALTFITLVQKFLRYNILICHEMKMTGRHSPDLIYKMEYGHLITHPNEGDVSLEQRAWSALEHFKMIWEPLKKIEENQRIKFLKHFARNAFVDGPNALCFEGKLNCIQAWFEAMDPILNAQESWTNILKPESIKSKKAENIILDLFNQLRTLILFDEEAYWHLKEIVDKIHEPVGKIGVNKEKEGVFVFGWRDLNLMAPASKPKTITLQRKQAIVLSNALGELVDSRTITILKKRKEEILQRMFDALDGQKALDQEITQNLIIDILQDYFEE